MPGIKRKTKFKEVIIILMVLAIALPVYAAEMYRWVDKEGVVHFSDDQPEGVKETKRLTVEDSKSSQEVPAVKLEAPGEKVTTPQPKPKKEPGRITSRTQQKLENFPLVLQKSNWCVLASMEMIFKYYGYDIDQDEIFKNMKGRRSRVREGEGLDERTAARFLSRAGFNVALRAEGELDTIKKYVDKKVPVMWGHLAPGK